MSSDSNLNEQLEMLLLDGNKHQQEIGKRLSANFSEFSDLIYELQTLINIGEL